MLNRIAVFAFCALISIAFTGCGSPPPPPEPVEPEPVDNTKVEELKKLEGSWILKSSIEASDRGVYPLNPNESGQTTIRIHEGIMEIRVGDEPWVKYATLAIGDDPQCLLASKPDIVGQQRVLLQRYKIEGNTMTVVQDNLYLDILPESFEITAGGERRRQINTYVKSDR
jgi:hypothetical protein